LIKTNGGNCVVRHQMSCYYNINNSGGLPLVPTECVVGFMHGESLCVLGGGVDWEERARFIERGLERASIVRILSCGAMYLLLVATLQSRLAGPRQLGKSWMTTRHLQARLCACYYSIRGF
jgi:hypothetical protein